MSRAPVDVERLTDRLLAIEKRDGVAVVRVDRKTNLNAFIEKLVVELPPLRAAVT